MIPIESRALAVMRTARAWKKNRLAKALRLQPGTLYDYERGKSVPSRELLERAAAVLALPSYQVDRTLAYLRQNDSAGSDSDAEREIDRIAVSMGLMTEELYRSTLKRGQREALAFVERQAAKALWAQLRSHPRDEWKAVASEARMFWRWGLAELIAHESVEAAADDADRALELAELAEVVALRVPEDEPLRLRIQGYAAAHVGNAFRVKGSLPQADEAFRRYLPLWQQGEAGDPERLLDEARVLGLEASLRREQRDLPEALRLLDQAQAADRRGGRTGRILIIRAKTLEEMGDYEEAVATLRRAEPHAAADRDPRVLLTLLFNLSENLFQIGRYEEAEPLLRQVRSLTIQKLDLVRLVWFEGRIAAGLGRPEEAEPALQQVRQEFLAREIGYDAALVSLELSVLYLGQGRTARVKALARELAPVFLGQKVPREAFATITLFQQAAESDTITLALARSCLEDLRRARSPERSEPAGEDPGRIRRGRTRPGKGTSQLG